MLLFMHVRFCFFLVAGVPEQDYSHFKMKKVDLARKRGQTSGSSLVLAWGQFGPIEMEIFLGQNLPNCKGQIRSCVRSIWKIVEPLWNLRGLNSA